MAKIGYLKVLTPVTTNGINPTLTADGRLKYRENHLDLMCEKRMIKKNEKLPAHLKHIIEVINDAPIIQASQPTVGFRTNPIPETKVKKQKAEE